MSENASVNGTPLPTVAQFVKALSNETGWYMLGVFMGVPTTELDTIDRNYGSYDRMRCLTEVYKCIESRNIPLSWQLITESLKSMKNHALAEKIHFEYILPTLQASQMPGQENRFSDSLPPQPSSPNEEHFLLKVVDDSLNEYVSDQRVVHGVWNSTQKEELTERTKKHRRERTERNQEEMVHLKQEIERLTNQLKESNQLAEQAPQEIRHVRRELTEQVQKKDEVIHQARLQIQTLQNNITANEEQIAQLAHQIQSLQNDITAKEDQVRSLQNNLEVKDRIIQRNETAIAYQEQQIRCYRDNPPWLIEREEVVMTEEVLGKGGWGEVKVGIFRGTRVAVKCLYELIVSECNLQLFSRTMDIASRVRHPNLLQFLGATRVGNPMIVTEIMPTSLRKELEKCPMTKPQVISIGKDVTSALNYLHLWKPQPILHRDVSSANVLLEPLVQGKLKAKLLVGITANFQENNHMASPGNPLYSAPEATTPKLQSPAMDIYSIGILLVEMATGEFPSSVRSERETQMRKVKWLSLKDLLYRCTNDDAKSRPSSKVLLQELQKQL